MNQWRIKLLILVLLACSACSTTKSAVSWKTPENPSKNLILQSLNIQSELGQEIANPQSLSLFTTLAAQQGLLIQKTGPASQLVVQINSIRLRRGISYYFELHCLAQLNNADGSPFYVYNQIIESEADSIAPSVQYTLFQTLLVDIAQRYQGISMP